MSAHQAQVAALILAAGASSRMGANKLLADLDGAPLVRRAAEAALGSRARPVLAVLGRDADLVREALAAALGGAAIETVTNPDYLAGLSTSLRLGIAELAGRAEGIVVLLGDMPGVGPRLVDALIAAFAGQAAVAPSRGGRLGNPVLLGAALFPAVARLTGDRGARALLAGLPGLATIEVDDDAAFLDLDTPEDLAAARSARGRTGL